MKILLTGATGFIGKSLVKSLLKQSHQLILWVRDIHAAKALYGEQVGYISDFFELNQDDFFDGIINLAGEPILEKYWTEKRKKYLLESRISITQSLIDLMNNLQVKPEFFISGSAIGYYGNRLDSKNLYENSSAVNDFSHQLCKKWEEAAFYAKDLGVRTCVIRTGIVLGQGGALEKMLLPFKLGFGGMIASGQQWMSWIHINDQIKAIQILMNNKDLFGVYNLTAPEPVTNKKFTQMLANKLNRPAFFKMPKLILKTIYGEGSELLIKGQKVLPNALQSSGFRFDFPYLELALEDILNIRVEQI